jgi:hypothetical protein
MISKSDDITLNVNKVFHQYHQITITPSLMKIIVLGNSPHFSHSLSSFLTNTPSAPFTSSLRLHANLFQYELAIGTGEMEVGGEKGLWALEVLQCDGIIYAFVY